jgi:hypothetical protein
MNFSFERSSSTSHRYDVLPKMSLSCRTSFDDSGENTEWGQWARFVDEHVYNKPLYRSLLMVLKANWNTPIDVIIRVSLIEEWSKHACMSSKVHRRDWPTVSLSVHASRSFDRHLVSLSERNWCVRLLLTMGHNVQLVVLERWIRIETGMEHR